MSDTSAHTLSASSVCTLPFEANSAILTHQAAVTLRGLIMNLRVMGCRHLDIVGFASPTEPPERHQALSAERAESMRSKLVQELGLARNQVSSTGRGSADATGDPEKDRRVIITVAR